MNELSRFTLHLAHRQFASLDFDQASIALIRRLRLVPGKPLPTPVPATTVKTPIDRTIAHAHAQSIPLPCPPVSAEGFSEWLDPLPYRWTTGDLRMAA